MVIKIWKLNLPTLGTWSGPGSSTTGPKDRPPRTGHNGPLDSRRSAKPSTVNFDKLSSTGWVVSKGVSSNVQGQIDRYGNAVWQEPSRAAHCSLFTISLCPSHVTPSFYRKEPQPGPVVRASGNGTVTLPPPLQA